VEFDAGYFLLNFFLIARIVHDYHLLRRRDSILTFKG
jgi:hypothetical protein